MMKAVRKDKKNPHMYTFALRLQETLFQICISKDGYIFASCLDYLQLSLVYGMLVTSLFSGAYRITGFL